MGKFDKYEAAKNVLRCPVCSYRMHLEERSLVCAQGHRFDIAKQGYVNLYRGAPINEYSKESFKERQTILEKGMYAHLLEEICSFIQGLGRKQDGSSRVVLDAGCGEGYYTREIAARLGNECILELYGVDLSRDSVQLAAATANQMGGAAADIKWFVSDISKLPVQNGKVDVIMDIFTSANYQEFQRVLAAEGYIVKIIPGQNHVRELREAARDHLFHKEYRERKGAAIFEEKFELVTQKTVSRTFEVTEQERDIFIGMTPLLFGVDKSKIDWSDVKTITVEGELLIGKKRQRR